MKIKWLRVLIAIGVGIVISTISIYVAWQNSNRAPAAWFEQHITQRQLKVIDQAITAYQQKFHTSPSTLEQLRSTTNDFPEMEGYFIDGLFVDGWQHPLIFTNEGTNCLVISYGGDGKPGGKGIDYDLTSKNPTPKESVPTFQQFLKNDRVRGMIDSSIVCGVLAAFLSLLTVRVPNLGKRGIIILILSLCATLIGTFFVTTIITALHIPSGH